MGRDNGAGYNRNMRERELKVGGGKEIGKAGAAAHLRGKRMSSVKNCRNQWGTEYL